MDQKIESVFTKELEALCREYQLAHDKFDKEQFVTLLRQMLQSGDFEKLVVAQGPKSGAQAFIYVPFAREQELTARIKELEQKLDQVRAQTFREAAQVCRDRSDHEEYGHAKAACMLDAEYLEAKADDAIERSES